MTAIPNQVLEAQARLDLRDLPVPLRYFRVFLNFAVLRLGESFLVDSEHDLSALRSELAWEQGPRMEWTVLEAGPDLWTARIARRG